jgi:hypothetical protein
MLNMLHQEAALADSLVEEACEYIGYIWKYLYQNRISEPLLSDNEKSKLLLHTSDVNLYIAWSSEITTHSPLDSDGHEGPSEVANASPKVSSLDTLPLTEAALKESQYVLCEQEASQPVK